MLAATGAIVQDLYTFPFMAKWYQGEKMWGLHEASIKSGALWQVRKRKFVILGARPIPNCRNPGTFHQKPVVRDDYTVSKCLPSPSDAT